MLRATWRASSSSSDALAPIRPRNAVIDSALFHVTTPRPRRTRHDAGSPTSPSRPASSRASADRHDELEVGVPAREAQRATRQEPAAQPGEPAVLRRVRPVERLLGQRERAADAPALEGMAAEADDEPRARPAPACGPAARARRSRRARSHGRDGSTAASSARSAATRSRSDPDIGSRSGRPVGARRACRAGPPPVPALALPGADQRGREALGVVMVGVRGVDEVVEDEPRPGARRWAASCRRDGLAEPARRRRARRTGCWRGRCPPGGRRRAARARRRGSRGRTRRSRPAASPRCTRTRPAPRTPRSPRGSRARRARAGCW